MVGWAVAMEAGWAVVQVVEMVVDWVVDEAAD